MSGFEVIICGGGLAGSAAAIRLAEAGKRVLLIEKEAQAKPKVCGEFLSIEAQEALKRLGIFLPLLGAVPVTHVNLNGGSISVRSPLPFHGMSLSREVLDEALLKRAESLGVEILRGVRVTGLTHDRTHWKVQATHHAPLTAHSVILATGKHQLKEFPRKANGKPWVGFKMQYKMEQKLPPEVALYFFRGGYAGLEAVEEGMGNLSIALHPRTLKRMGRNFVGVVEILLKKYPALAALLEGAEPCWPQAEAIANIPYGFLYRPSRRDPARLFYVGDQMAVIPSFTGDGMAMALHTGMAAAEGVAARDAYGYHRRMRRELARPLRWAAIVAYCSEHAVLRIPILRWMRCHPASVRTLASLTRIPVTPSESVRPRPITFRAVRNCQAALPPAAMLLPF